MRPLRVLLFALALAVSFTQASADPERNYLRWVRRDFYGALNVSSDANTTTISKRYRRLALQFHPDKLHLLPKQEQKKADVTFKEIAEAKEVLVNADTRAAYDKVISGLPRFARPKYGSRSIFDKDKLKLGPLFVTSVCVGIGVLFVTINQRVNQLSDKASILRSERYGRWLKGKRKVLKEDRYKPGVDKTPDESEKYFKVFQLEEMLVFKEGWEHTLLGGFVWKARGKGPVPLSIAETAAKRRDEKNREREALVNDSAQQSDAPRKGKTGKKKQR
jgi:hypothetical protein